MKTRAKKPVLQVKNAKEMLEILNSNPQTKITDVAKKLKIWPNVARNIKKLLEQNNLIGSPYSNLNSAYKDILVSNFKNNKKVYQSDIIKEAGVSRLTAGMKQDLDKLISSGYVTKSKEGIKVVYTIK